MCSKNYQLTDISCNAVDKNAKENQIHLVENQHFALVCFNQVLVQQVQDAAWGSNNYMH